MTDVRRIDGAHLERARRARFEVVLVMPGADATAWGRALVRSVEETLSVVGARLAAVIDAGDEAPFAARALARAMVLEPSAVISRPVGGVAAADAHRSLGRAGVTVVLLDEAPGGLLPERDFATVVAFDEVAIGTAAAELAAGAVSREGGVGILGAATDPLAGSDRERAFRTWIRTERPDIRLSAGRYGEAAAPGAAALRLLADDPGIEALVVAEDAAAVELVKRLDAAGHRPAVITVDLGPEVAVDLASGGLVRAVLARQPWEQGEAAATAAVLALLGHEVPRRIAVPALTVTRESVLEAFLEIWHEHPPAELAAARWGKRQG